MTETKTSPEAYLRVYRNSPEFSDYLTARFGSSEQSVEVFAYRGAIYRFTHSSSDHRGMFDVLERVDGTASEKQ